MIILGADQAPESLAKLDDCFGQLVVDEGVSAGGTDCVELGLQQRVVGDCEGQFGDDDVL